MHESPTYFSVEEFQERTLSSSVGAHEGETGVQINSKLQVLVDQRRLVIVAAHKTISQSIY
jgi:hypothetical protein